MAWSELSAAQVQALLGFTRALTGDRGLAEDIVQEVLIRLHRNADLLAGVHDRPAYARRMAVNEYLSWGRKWFRIRPAESLPDVPAEADHAQRTVDADDLRTRLAGLPRKQRAVLVLRYYAGLTDAEIATELGCTTGTVRSHASRALATLRVELKADEEAHR